MAKKNKSLPTTSQPMSILVMRYSSLGDVALTNPVLDALDRAYPNAQIHFAIKDRYVPAVGSHPAINRVLELRGGGFWNFVRHLREVLAVRPTLVLDLHNSLRTHIISFFLWRSRILTYDKETVQRRLLVKKLRKEPSLHTINKYLKVLEPLGIPMQSKVDFKVHVSKGNHQFLRDFLSRRKISPSRIVVGLGPGARWKTKQWMPENYAEMASGLVKDHNALLFWFGSREEKKLIQSIQARMSVNVLDRGLCLAGDYSLEQSIALLGRCDLFVGNDSGLIHLASGRGTRVVVLYGSTAPSLGFEPWGPHSVVEVANLPCRPCHVHGYNACPLGHFKCMKELSVNLVEGAVNRSLQRSR